MTIKECKDGLLKLEDLVYETHQWLVILEINKKELNQLREENESLKKEIEAYKKLIESEIGFGEGEE